ncbi:MAG: hypothetical protein KC496_15490 [Anaerolineae bacterium]|nr:hypothetical protein [Anaerolineae bacterium]
MDQRASSTIYLIGGTPGAGKTTLGKALAARLGVHSFTIDDLVTGAIAVTTPESHPGLHALRKMPHIEYYTNSSIEQLKQDATLRHEATWPMVKSIIRKHHQQKTGIVIDGWHIRPAWVAALNIPEVQSYWIVINEQILEQREKHNASFFQASPQPEKMFQNFMARSLWYNQFIEEEATAFGMKILRQTGDVSTEEFCEMILGTHF